MTVPFKLNTGGILGAEQPVNYSAGGNRKISRVPDLFIFSLNISRILQVCIKMEQRGPGIDY
jgi:hypothetical protein